MAREKRYHVYILASAGRFSTLANSRFLVAFGSFGMTKFWGLVRLGNADEG